MILYAPSTFCSKPFTSQVLVTSWRGQTCRMHRKHIHKRHCAQGSLDLTRAWNRWSQTVHPKNAAFFFGVERFIPAKYGISGGDSYLIWDDYHETIQLHSCEHVDAADASEPTRIAIVAKDWLPNLFVLKHGVDSKLFWVLIQDV